MYTHRLLSGLDSEGMLAEKCKSIVEFLSTLVNEIRVSMLEEGQEFLLISAKFELWHFIFLGSTYGK